MLNSGAELGLHFAVLSGWHNMHRRCCDLGLQELAAAAAVAATVGAVEAATAAAAGAGPEGDVAVPDELSPIPGLPVRPEPGGLSGPLATLQLVIHR